MREILFRGKRKDNIEWIEGYLTVCDDRYFIVEKDKVGCLCFDTLPKGHYVFMQYLEIIPETLGQFTGKYDKNGKKIFEGDIVEAMMDYGPAGLLKTITRIYWDDNGGWQWEYFETDTIEVIGNIHDNADIRFGIVE